MLIQLKMKYFNSNLQTSILLQLVSCFAEGFDIFGSLFYSWKNCFLAIHLGDMMYFACTFTLFWQRKEATLTKVLLLCESSDTFALKCKFLASNIKVILAYWSIKNIFLAF